jgi:hypothetical protein
MLGDLHLKQGRAREAGAAFAKAHNISPTRELCLKTLQAYTDAGDAESLRAAQDFMATLAKRAETSKKKAASMGSGSGGSRSARPATVAPRKLVVTITKDSADQVAQGKLSFQEFVKKAVVERQ